MWPLILLGLLVLSSPKGASQPRRLADLPRVESKIYPWAHALPFPASSEYGTSPVGTQRRLVRGVWEDEFGRNWTGRTPSLLETLGAGADISGIPGMEELAETITALGGLWGELAQSPLWDIYITTAYYLPGGGPLVSAGMRMAVELGRGASFEDAAVASAREALPPGIARSGFDVAIGARDLNSVGREELRKYVSEELGPVGVKAYNEGMQRYG